MTTADPQRWEIVYAVPADVTELAVHLPDAQARTTLRDLVDDSCPPRTGEEERAGLVDALFGIRTQLMGARLTWSGLVSTFRDDGTWLFVQLGLSLHELLDPGPFPLDVVYQALARQRYGDGAVIGPLGTPHTAGIGVRRSDVLRLGAQVGGPAAPTGPPTGRSAAPAPVRLGITEAILPFPEVGACAVLTGVSLGLHGLDAAAILVSAMAQQVMVLPRTSAAG